MPEICVVPQVWAEALAGVGTLPSPSAPSVYYWPPPFWFEALGGKVNRYFHNYVRIRVFCWQRLLDTTLDAHLLHIANWRDALWGDYTISHTVSTGEALPSTSHRRVRELQHETTFSAKIGAGEQHYVSISQLISNTFHERQREPGKQIRVIVP